MEIKSLGWHAGWDELIDGDHQVARIIAVHRGQYKAISKEGPVNLTLPGKFLKTVTASGDYPAVGDWVKIGESHFDGQGNPSALIELMLPRKSKISRIASGSTSEEQVIASNVELAFVVSSANQDLNIKRLKRYILIANAGDVKPVMILSKSDLSKNLEEVVNNLKVALGDVTVLAISSKEGVGVEKVLELMAPGTTSVFVGSSGVGKSTLVNFLLGDDVQLIKEVRDGDDKGKHTTTTRELFFLPNGAMIVDTPGLREVQVFGDTESVGATFENIEALAGQCRFTNCLHKTEPGCAILAALEANEIDEDDLENYSKLQREAEFSLQKMDKQASSNAKKRWKQINVDYKKGKKFNKKR